VFKIRASVLATHGLEDENVRPDHFSNTGSVQFKHDDQDLGAPVPLAGGVAKMTTKAIPQGDHGLSAACLGDGGFDPSVSEPVDHVVACPAPPQAQGGPPCGSR
jgi:hypothetical protein